MESRHCLNIVIAFLTFKTYFNLGTKYMESRHCLNIVIAFLKSDLFHPDLFHLQLS